MNRATSVDLADYRILLVGIELTAMFNTLRVDPNALGLASQGRFQVEQQGSEIILDFDRSCDPETVDRIWINLRQTFCRDLERGLDFIFMDPIGTHNPKTVH
ncbi:MAG TPA: hypothetical protein VD998_00815 [Verrucomicrobiae bacterium]|nr:hypothetical protein [Verrucomicrobiae bacterium]